MLWNVDVFREMDKLRKEMDGLFTNFGRATGARTFPLVNVYDSSESVMVTAELPGMTKEDVHITFSDGVLTLSGKCSPCAAAEGMTMIRQERSAGDFEKSIQIPAKVITDKINAAFENGVLTVTLPKSEEAKPRTITIDAK